MGSQETTENLMFKASRVDDFAAVRVGDGCWRRDLSDSDGVRVWIVDMEPGSTWPYVDDHDTGEHYYVVHGEVIEGEQRYAAGTYVRFAPSSSHRPKTDGGVRLFGFNLDVAAFAAARGGAVARAGRSNPDRFNFSQG